MINKKSLWFLTLFSLILVLSVYYVTMPSELLLNNNSDYTKNKESKTKETPTVKVEESEMLVSLRVEADEVMTEELDKLKEILTNKDATVEQKNQAYDKMKIINNTRAEEEKIETLIKDKYKIQSFAKIEGDQVKIVVCKDKHDLELANNIMRLAQENFQNKMYISVKFQK